MLHQFEENLCPFCRKPNRCGVNAAGGCWCGPMEIPMELIELLPEQGKACICGECVQSFQQNPENFTHLIQTGLI